MQTPQTVVKLFVAVVNCSQTKFVAIILVLLVFFATLCLTYLTFCPLKRNKKVALKRALSFIRGSLPSLVIQVLIMVSISILVVMVFNILTSPILTFLTKPAVFSSLMIFVVIF